ncbi:MAG: hypothetical protein IKR37_03110 [Paludibacteraceae bacterium]|nr:hypothetical protein [Paludibacteraceae bacterium]
MKTKVLLLLLCINMMAYADAIYVYNVTDTVEFYHNGEWKPAYKTLALEAEDSLRMGEFASISLLPKGADTPYPVQFKSTLTVQEALEQGSPAKRSTFRETISGLWHEIFQPGHVSMEHYNTQHGATYRGSASEQVMAYAVENPAVSDFDISFALINANTMNIVDSQVTEDIPLILQVTNKSNTPLFVNLIDISNDGMSPVLPIDEKGLMGHLLIPANATVRFSERHMRFSFYGAGTDTLILLASPEAFDLTEVIKLAEQHQGNKTSEKIGVCKKQVKIQIPL